MTWILRSIGIIALLCLVALVVLHIIPIKVSPSLLVKNPQIIKLKGVDKSTPVIAKMNWKDFRIRLSGMKVKAEILGQFEDPANTLSALINPNEPITISDKKNLKIMQMPNSQLACAGAGTELLCRAKLKMRIKTRIGNIKNTLTLDSKSSSFLEEQQISFQHRIISGQGVPRAVLKVINNKLKQKDKSRPLPRFFTNHNVTITDYTFVGNSTNGDLGIFMHLQISLADLLRAIIS